MIINRIRIVQSEVQPAPAVLNRKDSSVKRDPRGWPYTGYKRKVSGNDKQSTTAKDSKPKPSDTLELSKEALA